MTSAQIRRQFIDFFVQKHGHTFVPSSPVVPLDDPTLLFANAGMNQFKPIFLGTEKRPYTRAANTQKCIRAGGKHNDLDDVGRSRRHHTFFEMLGNWSFGDYFKQGAIEMAWELLTQVWKIDPTRLHVSCFEGDEKNGVPRDTEAADIWKRVAKLPDDHIHYFGKDNFWEMGESGPCGPCTEIYIDRTPDKSGGSQVNGEDPRVMEIWNLVFIQYNRDAAGKLTTLPSQHVDTGMGLERICQVLQGKDDNYAIDLFTPLFDALTKLTGIQYTGLFPPTNAADPIAEAANAQLRHDIAFRVIADHVRCLTFALTDGAIPSNEGRGYVLRRILRRAVFWGWQHLKIKEPFLHTLVPVVVDSMSEAFSELRKDPEHVMELIKDEEVGFGRTLDRGIHFFEDAAAKVKGETYAKANNLINAGTARRSRMTASGVESEVSWTLSFGNRGSSGETFDIPLDRVTEELRVAGIPIQPMDAHEVFKLHDTYGFPIDLTRIMAEECGLTVDLPGYEALMEEAKERSRGRTSDEDFSASYLPPGALAQLEREHIPKTDDSLKYKDGNQVIAKVVQIWDGISFPSEGHAAEDKKLAVILDKTNFYAEMGGQVGDVGELGAPGTKFLVMSTKSIGGYVLHIGRLASGSIKLGTHLSTQFDALGRARIEKNHTATHLANWALREVLGENVQQKGSLVDPDKLRFDFSHGKPMSEEEVGRVEELVGKRITQNLRVFAMEAPQEQALKINGLRAVFGEKYPPMVRVVSIGAPVSDLLDRPDDPNWRKYSVEFCGGTHLRTTAEIGDFVVTGEELVSKGIRRIFALTGEAAQDLRSRDRAVESLLKHAASKPDADLAPAIAALQKATTGGDLSLRTRRRLQTVVAELQDRFKKWEKANKARSGTKLDIAELSSRLLESAPALGPGKLVVSDVPGAAPEQLLSLVDSLKKKSPSYAVLLGATDEGKVSFVAAVSDDLIAKGLKAGDWIRETAKATGGGGGGRPQMAQAGGKDPAKLPDALTTAKRFAQTAIS
jgi:alanyl-tRNA synthetase